MTPEQQLALLRADFAIAVELLREIRDLLRKQQERREETGLEGRGA